MSVIFTTQQPVEKFDCDREKIGRIRWMVNHLVVFLGDGIRAGYQFTSHVITLWENLETKIMERVKVKIEQNFGTLCL